jgi:hypothetical protein
MKTHVYRSTVARECRRLIDARCFADGCRTRACSVFKSIIDLQANAAILAVASVSEKWARLRTRLHAGCGLVNYFTLGFVRKLAVAGPQFDLCIPFATPNRAVTATTRGGQWLGLACQLYQRAHFRPLLGAGWDKIHAKSCSVSVMKFPFWRCLHAKNMQKNTVKIGFHRIELETSQALYAARQSPI